MTRGPRGIHAARKLRLSQKEQNWADKNYRHRALGSRFRSSPFSGASHAKGIVLEKVGVEAKQPNSAIRKCVRVQLIKNGKKVTAFGALAKVYQCVVKKADGLCSAQRWVPQLYRRE